MNREKIAPWNWFKDEEAETPARTPAPSETDDPFLALRSQMEESEEEDEGYHCVERSYGMVQRMLSLPDDADPDAIEAKFKNGVLELRIPKRASTASRGRLIEIQRG
jgi:HSP20 family protein